MPRRGSSANLIRPGNLLLAALPENVWRRLAPAFERIAFDLKQPMYEPNRPIEHVYFPESGVYSIVAQANGEMAVEVATVGPEGLIGTAVLLQTPQSTSRAFCQIPGDVLRMETESFRQAVRRHPDFAGVALRYTQVLIDLMAQSAACNRLHTLEQRTARWLLMTHDRVRSDQFLLTQEFLSQMLGVRRAGVSVAAGMLQRAGVISYSRGRINILNRAGLEKITCDCYWIIRRQFERLNGQRA